MNKAGLFAIAFLFFFNFSCARDPQKNILYYPVLDECKDQTIGYLEKKMRNESISFEYIAVKDPLFSQSHITGFVKIASGSLPIYEVSNIFSGLKERCYPNNSMSFNIEESSYEIILNDIRRLREQGVTQKIYMELDGKILTIYFHKKGETK